MCLLSGIANRGTNQLVKFFDVFGCQVGQISILAVVPDLLNGVKVRRIGRQPFNTDGLGMIFQVPLQYFCPMDAPPIHDDYYPPMDITREAAQESNHILSTDILSLNTPIKSDAATMGGKGNGTDDRESIMTAPLAEYRCLASGCPCSPYQRLEHESTLIHKHDAPAFLFSVFLYPAIFLYAKPESVPHSFPCPSAVVFDNSNHKHGESSTHGPDDTLPQNGPRLAWLSAAVSIVDLYTHEPEALRGVVPAVPPSASEISGKVAPDEASPPMLLFLLSLSPPSSVSQRTAMILPAGLLLECPDPSPTGLPLFVFELLVPPHFLLVSCIIIYSCIIRNAIINNILCSYAFAKTFSLGYKAILFCQ